MRSAPTTTPCTEPLASKQAAAPSASSVHGMPSCTASHAVRRAPWRTGRASHANRRGQPACGVEHPHDPERAPDPPGGQRSGVAVREQRHRAAREQRCTVFTHGKARGGVGLVERTCRGKRTLEALLLRGLFDHPEHVPDRLRQVGTGGPSGGEPPGRTPEVRELGVAARASAAKAYAAVRPIAGAPRTARARIARTAAAPPGTLTQRSRPGSRRWSSNSSPSRQRSAATEVRTSPMAGMVPHGVAAAWPTPLYCRSRREEVWLCASRSTGSAASAAWSTGRRSRTRGSSSLPSTTSPTRPPWPTSSSTTRSTASSTPRSRRQPTASRSTGRRSRCWRRRNRPSCPGKSSASTSSSREPASSPRASRPRPTWTRAQSGFSSPRRPRASTSPWCTASTRRLSTLPNTASSPTAPAPPTASPRW